MRLHLTDEGLQYKQKYYPTFGDLWLDEEGKILWAISLKEPEGVSRSSFLAYYKSDSLDQDLGEIALDDLIARGLVEER